MSLGNGESSGAALGLRTEAEVKRAIEAAHRRTKSKSSAEESAQGAGVGATLGESIDENKSGKAGTMSDTPSREEFEARLREQEARSAAKFAELMGEVRTSNAELRGSVNTAFAELRGELKALPTKNEERNYFLGLLGTIIVVAFGLTAMYYSHQQSTQAALANGIAIGEAGSSTNEAERPR